MTTERKIGDQFVTKNGKIRVENVADDKITYSIFPVERNQGPRRTIIDTVETFEKRFPKR